jgi:hypothetical protein
MGDPWKPMFIDILKSRTAIADSALPFLVPNEDSVQTVGAAARHWRRPIAHVVFYDAITVRMDLSGVMMSPNDDDVDDDDAPLSAGEV